MAAQVSSQPLEQRGHTEVGVTLFPAESVIRTKPNSTEL